MDSSRFDFLGYCASGAVLKTRDRREARVTGVDLRAGVIHGEIQTMGACRWRGDGRYLEAPAGAAGPWDLMPPIPEARPIAARSSASLAEALQNTDVNPGCCD